MKRYYHKVLEAKLVLEPDIIISPDTEFIENENEKVSKNDCEISNQHGETTFGEAAEGLPETAPLSAWRCPLCGRTNHKNM